MKLLNGEKLEIWERKEKEDFTGMEEKEKEGEQVEIEELQDEEIGKAASGMKRRKAAGIDEIIEAWLFE